MVIETSKDLPNSQKKEKENSSISPETKTHAHLYHVVTN